MKESLAYVLECMLTCDKMQNINPLMCTKFEIWWQSILEVIKAFHIVRIILYIWCSGPVVECLNKISQLLDHWARTPDIKNYAYSMKSLNSFQNAPVSDMNFFHIKDCYLAF